MTARPVTAQLFPLFCLLFYELSSIVHSHSPSLFFLVVSTNHVVIIIMMITRQEMTKPVDDQRTKNPFDFFLIRSHFPRGFPDDSHKDKQTSGMTKKTIPSS